MSYDRRQEAVSILDSVILDLMVGSRSLDIFSAVDAKTPLSPGLRAGLGRLSTMHLVLALAKWMEFYERYKNLLPKTTADTAKTFYKQCKQRRVRDFRNKVIGHIWDSDIRKPLSAENTQERLAKVIGDEEAFNRWIYDPDAVSPTGHLVGLMEEIRNALANG